MPLNASSLGTQIKSAIEAAYGPADDAAILAKFADAIASAVVTHIKTNATITLIAGDVPVQVSTGTGTGANTVGAPLNGKIS